MWAGGGEADEREREKEKGEEEVKEGGCMGKTTEGKQSSGHDKRSPGCEERHSVCGKQSLSLPTVSLHRSVPPSLCS